MLTPDLQVQLRLARDLGMTLRQLRRRMHTREYLLWVAMYKQEAREYKKMMDKAKAKGRGHRTR